MHSLAVYLDEIALGALQADNNYPMQIEDWTQQVGLVSIAAKLNGDQACSVHINGQAAEICSYQTLLGPIYTYKD